MHASEMSELQGATASNIVVLCFCELLGWMLGLPAGDAIYRGEYSLRAFAFGGIGLFFVALGPTWPVMRSRLPQFASTGLAQIASDVRWWLALTLALFVTWRWPLLYIQTDWRAALAGALIASLLIIICLALIAARPKRVSATVPTDASLFDQDASVMVHLVQFYTHLYVTGDPKLTGNAPFIEFLQPMINASVFPIAFEKEIEGRLFIDGEEQKDKLEIRETPPQSLKVRRAAHHELVFRQWLSTEVARKIQEQTETIFDFGKMAVYFTFEYHGDRPRVRKALGNQVIWKNIDKKIAELLAYSRSATSDANHQLQIQFRQKAPYLTVHHPRTFYKIGVYNNSAQIASHNVHLRLMDISPRPKELHAPAFPYGVTRANVGEDEQDLKPSVLNPKSEELFEIAQSWISGGDNRLIVNRIDTKPALKRAIGGAFQIHPDEHWRLHYRVSSANHAPLDFFVHIEPRGGETLSVYLENGNSN